MDASYKRYYKVYRFQAKNVVCMDAFYYRFYRVYRFQADIFSLYERVVR